MRWLGAILFIALTACEPKADVAASTAARFDGVGPVSLGMNVVEAEQALGAKLNPFANSGYSSQACWQTARTDGRDPDVLYMVEDGYIIRIDVFQRDRQPASTTRTAEGLGIGSTTQQVAQAFGDRLKQSPHPYLGAQGKYLEVLAPDGQRGLLFETAGDTVTSYRTGILPSLEYKERCS